MMVTLVTLYHNLISTGRILSVRQLLKVYILLGDLEKNSEYAIPRPALKIIRKTGTSPLQEALL